MAQVPEYWSLHKSQSGTHRPTLCPLLLPAPLLASGRQGTSPFTSLQNRIHPSNHCVFGFPSGCHFSGEFMIL